MFTLFFVFSLLFLRVLCVRIFCRDLPQDGVVAVPVATRGRSYGRNCSSWPVRSVGPTPDTGGSQRRINSSRCGWVHAIGDPPIPCLTDARGHLLAQV